MELEQWQLNLIELLKDDGKSLIPARYVDSVLVFLNKFDVEQDPFAAVCVEQSKSESEAQVKEKILRLIDQTLLFNELDIVQIFGRESFADKSRKTFKVRYQRLCRAFHPDHGLADHQFLNQRMAVINSSHDLAEKNFENPFAVNQGRSKKTKTFTSTKASSFSTSGRGGQYTQPKPIRRKQRRKSNRFFRRLRRKLIRYLYRTDDFFRGANSSGKLKLIIGCLTILMLAIMYQFIVSGSAGKSVNSYYLVSEVSQPKIITSQPHEKELQASEIEKILDEMLKENSTQNITKKVSVSPASEVSAISVEDNKIDVEELEKEILRVKNFEQKLIQASNNTASPPQPSVQQNVIAKSEVAEQDRASNNQKVVEKLKSKKVAQRKSQAISLPKQAKHTLALLQHFYNEAKAESFTSLFSDQGAYFEFTGKTNIKNAVQGIFDRVQYHKISLEFTSQKHLGSWLVLYGTMLDEYQLKNSTEMTKKKHDIEVVLYRETNGSFLISSVLKKQS